MKNICQKVAVAAATTALCFAALDALPAEAASFALGSPNSKLFIQFSGNVSFDGVNQASVGLDNLDSFQARFRYVLSPDSYEEGTWSKQDLLNFSFFYNPLKIDRPHPSDPDLSALRFEARNSRGATLSMMPESKGFTMAYLPIECPPFAPPGIECGYSDMFRVGRGAVYRVADDSAPVPIPEGTVIPGLALGIGWLIQKRQRLAPK
ncbi:MAG: hypothetical protein MUE44_24845 [Oscillatoriaceae cyanobacterium Prado104]|jgi:hypothetical protein|nr:hypothetical protein [Oscillatoriaceae cyanobacterium Prado104]